MVEHVGILSHITLYAWVMSLRVRYSNFWPTFSPDQNLFSQILRKYADSKLEIILDPKAHVDLEIYSVFYFESHFKQIALKIKSQFSSDASWEYSARFGRGFKLTYPENASRSLWFTGENKRFPLNHFDGRISFDPTDSEFNNIFFPYWMLRLNWGLEKNEYEIQPRPEDLVQNRNPVERKMNVCSFSNLKESNRERIIQLTGDHFEIETYGRAVNRPVKSKLEVSSEYGLQICTENDLYPNYVTEKLQEAWFARNVPIWTGLDADKWFNRDAIIDLTLLNSEEVHAKLSELNTEKMLHMQTLPLLTRMPTLEPLIKVLLEQVP
jgi:hypothetical protein